MFAFSNYKMINKYLHKFCQQLYCFGIIWRGYGLCMVIYLKVLKLYIMAHNKSKNSTMDILNVNVFLHICSEANICKYIAWD